MAMTDYFDALETRDPARREAELMQALARQVVHARQHAPAFAALLANVDVTSIDSRAALARLPVTRKHELLERQRAQRTTDPFGGFSTLVRGPAMPRIFSSPGPIYEPEGASAITGAPRALSSPRGSARATWCTTPSATT